MNDREKISGRMVSEIKKSIGTVEDVNWLTEEWVENFWKKEKNNFTRLFSKINKFSRSFSSFLKNSSKSIPIESDIIEDSSMVCKFFNKPVQ